MTEEKLTAKQRAFVEHYVGESRFHAATAAKLAGYSENTARSQGTRLLSNANVRAAINAHLDSIKTDGLRDRSQRIDSLQRQERAIYEAQMNRAEEVQARIVDGEDIPPYAASGLFEETVKVYGNGPNARTERSWTFDKAMNDARTKLAEQIARELGERVDKLQVDVTNPIVIESAKAKLSELLADGA